MACTKDSSVYVAGQVLKKLLAEFPEKKVSGQEELAKKKSDLIYGALEAYPKVYKVRLNLYFLSRDHNRSKDSSFV